MNAQQLDYIVDVVTDEVVKSKIESSEWKKLVKRTDLYERKITGVLRSYFNQQEKAVMIALTKFRKAVAFPFVTEKFINSQKDELSEVIFPLIKSVVENEGKAAVQAIQARTIAELESFNMDAAVLASIKKLVNTAATEVTETTFKRLLKQYDTGIELGESLAEIKLRVADVFKDAVKNRIKMIARTETMKAVTESKLQAYKQSGVINKVRYYCALDERVCNSCFSYHDRVYPVNSSKKPEIPLHPLCRCCWMPEVDPDYLKSWVDTYKYLVQKMGTASSGNHGHAGRPGKVGGSADRQYLDTLTTMEAGYAWKGKVYRALDSQDDQATLGEGLYVTPEKEAADLYGKNVVAYDVHIKNVIGYNSSEYDTIREKVKAGKWNTTHELSVKIGEAVKKQGYDAVYGGSVFGLVLFYPNKQATLLTPKKTYIKMGMPGRSGHFNHEGIPNHRGGSKPSKYLFCGWKADAFSKAAKVGKELNPDVDKWLWSEDGTDSLASINEYVNYEHVTVNNRLRHGKGYFLDENSLGARETKATIQGIDDAMKRASTKTSVMVARGINEEVYKKLNKQVGKTFTDKGFVSTTLTPFILFSGSQWNNAYYSTIMIKVPKGTRALYIQSSKFRTGQKRENEVLIDRGYKYKVRKENLDIVLEVLPK